MVFRNIKNRIRETILSMLPEKEHSYVHNFKLSFYAKIITTVVILAAAAAIYFIITNSSGNYLGWWVPIFIFAVLMLAIISAPVAMFISEEKIEIHAVLEVIEIEVKNIKKITPINKSYAIKYFIPLITTYGFFGFSGYYFDIPRLKIIRLVCTSKQNLLMIECVDDKNIVISATNQSEVIELINNACERINS